MAVHTLTLKDGSTLQVEAPRDTPVSELVDLANQQSNVSGKQLVEQRRQERSARSSERGPSQYMAVPEPERGLLGDLRTGFGTGFVETGEMAALGAATLLDEENELAARGRIQSVADAIKPNVREGDKDDIAFKIGQTFGSIAGFAAPIAGAAAAAPAAVPAAAVGTGIGALLGVGAAAGEASERARAAGATQEERNRAIRQASPVGLLEVAPLGRFMRSVDIPVIGQFIKDLGPETVETIGQRIQNAAITGGGEAAQEVTAEIVQNLAERGYNPERAIMEGTGESALYGGGAGATIQFLVDAFTNSRKAGADTGPAQGELFGEGEDLGQAPERVMGDQREMFPEQDLGLAPERPDERQLNLFDAQDQQSAAFARTARRADEERERMLGRPISEFETEGDPFLERTKAERDAARAGIAGLQRPQRPEPEQRDMIRELEQATIPEEEQRAQAAAREREALRAVGRNDEAAFEQPDLFALQQEEERRRLGPEELRRPDQFMDVPEAAEPREATVRERDLVDLAQERQQAAQEDADIADQLAAMDAEEATQRQQAETLRAESAAETAQGKMDTDRAAQTSAIRTRVLQDTVANAGDIKQPVALRNAFESALSEAGLREPKATPQEMESLRRASSVMRAKDPALETVAEQESVKDPGQLEMEARVAPKGFAPLNKPAVSSVDLGQPLEVFNVTSQEAQPTAGGRSVPAPVGDVGARPARPVPSPAPAVEATGEPTAPRDSGLGSPVVEPRVSDGSGRAERDALGETGTTRKVVPTFPEKTAATKKGGGTRFVSTKASQPLRKDTATAKVVDKETAAKKVRAELKKRWESRATDVAKREYAAADNIVKGDPFTPAENRKILKLLETPVKSREKAALDAAVTYLGLYPNPAEGLYLAMWEITQVPAKRGKQDVAMGTPQSRGDPLLKGTGGKAANKAVKWAQENLDSNGKEWVRKSVIAIQKDLMGVADADLTVAQLKEQGVTDPVQMQREKEALEAEREEAEEMLEAEAANDFDAEKQLNFTRIKIDKLLKANAVVGLDLPLHPSVGASIKAGDLRGALLSLADTSPSNQVRNIAAKLAGVVGDRKNLARAKAATKGSKVKSVVYHGSGKTDITEFKPSGYTQGLYFSPNRGLAQDYMVQRGDGTGRVYEVMLDIKNPLVIKGTYKKSLSDRIDVALGRKSEKDVRAEQRDRRSASMILSAERIKELKSQGYDGIMNEDAMEYVAFDASQVHMVDGPDGGTKLVIKKDLKAADGRPAAGMFDPETNTITLDEGTGINAHTLIHEMTHAAASATLSNKAHPLTKQITKLFETTKEYLGTAYGAQNVDEFFSEAMSNPDFRAMLATINVKGEPVSALRRFLNSMGNFVRRLMGRPTTPLDAMETVDTFVDGLLAPAPQYRNSGQLLMSSTADGAKKVLNTLVSRTQKKFGTPEARKDFRRQFGNDSMQFLESNVADNAKRLLLQLTGSQAMADIAKAAGLGNLGYKLDRIINEQRGSIRTANEQVKREIDKVVAWVDKAGDAKKETLDRLIYNDKYGATIHQVDPTLTAAEAKKRYAKDSDKMAVWNEQRKDWNALGADGQRTYKIMRDSYRNQYEKMRAVIFGEIDELMADNPEAANKLKNEVYGKLFDKGTLDVYFPLIREGQYKLTYAAKNPASPREAYVVEMFTTRRERDQAAAEVKADKNFTGVETFDGEMTNSDFKNAPPASFVAQTLRTLSANGVDGDVQTQIMRLFVNALPETSFAKSLQKRKGTPGYMTNSVYAMKSKAYDLAGQTEKLKYAAILRSLDSEIGAQVTPEGAAQAKSRFGKYVQGTRASFEEVKKELLDRSKFAREGARNKDLEAYGRRLNQTAFIFTIGFNVSSALVNLSQVPLFVMPFLGGKYGYPETGKAVWAAGSIVKSSKNSILSNYDIRDDGVLSVKRDLDVPAERRKELEELAPLAALAMKRGQLGQGYLAEALGLEESGRVSRGGKVGAVMDNISVLSAYMFNHGEQYNRQVTLVTAYKLALQKLAKDSPSMTRTERMDKAAEMAIYETQETNGGSFLETAPPIARENIGRVAFMYKSYGLQMYYSMFKAAKTAFDSDKGKLFGPEGSPERKAAWKQLLGLHGTALFFAGIQGVPLYGAVQLMADLIFRDDEEDDFDTMVRKYVGEGWYKGAITKFAGIDVASRVALTGLLIQENRYNNDPSLEENLGHYLGGPALSVAKRLGRGVSDLASGETQRGIENMMPVAIANAYKGTFGRYADQGGAFTRRADPIYDDMTAGEMASQVLGFPPTEYTFRQEQNMISKRIDIAVGKKRSGLHKKYYVAMRLGDFEAADSVFDEIMKFNDRHPEAAITPNSIERSMNQHAKTSSEMYNGVSLSPLYRRTLEQLRSEYSQ